VPPLLPLMRCLHYLRQHLRLLLLLLLLHSLQLKVWAQAVNCSALAALDSLLLPAMLLLLLVLILSRRCLVDSCHGCLPCSLLCAPHVLLLMVRSHVHS
jgi:hypothetical protein